jgi:hypothetical protein
MAADLNFRILPLVQMKEDGSPINLQEIAAVCGGGLNECPPEDRLLAWLLLSGVLPLSPEEWSDFRLSTVTQYREFMRVFRVDGHDSKIFANSTSVTDFGVPNNALMGLIHADIIRTGRHIRFFPDPDPAVGDVRDDPLLRFHAHMRRLERILYIFANCNRTLSYMQGFNEIVAVLYYVFASAIIWFNYDWQELESFVFYTFQRMCSSTRLGELFCTQDQSSLILGSLRSFMGLMEKHLPKAAAIARKHKIHPMQFCYRKLNLAFSQDHEMTGLVLIWDALFSHFREFVEYEQYIMIALLKLVEELLDPDDYSQTMVVLQKLNGCANNPKRLVESANRFWTEDHRRMTT